MGLPLVTRTEYKTYKELNTTADDAAIDLIIPKVSDLIKSICRRTFVDYVNDSKIEYSEGNCPFIALEESPVLSISSFQMSTDYGKTYTNLVQYTDYAYSQIQNVLVPIGRTDFPLYINGYKITYTAGYEVLPEDLKMAALDLVHYYLRNEMSIHSSKSAGSNNMQIEYITNTNLPAHIKRVLDLYAANYN
jgi:hypothetical protein